MSRGSPKVNHFAFADNMIILCKTELNIMQKMTSTLEKYKRMSSQKVNKEKNSLYLHKGVSHDVVMAEVVTQILRKYFPFNYLVPYISHKKEEGLLPEYYE